MDDSCSFCEEGNSIALHFFFACSFTRSIWQREGLAGSIFPMIGPCPQSWYKKLVQLMKSFDLELFGMLVYYIWFHGIDLFEGTTTDAFSLIALASHARPDFRDANKWSERVAASLLS